MGRRLQLRTVTDEERQAVTRLARARTAPTRTVERAQVVQAAREGTSVEEIAVRLPLARNTVYLWLHRFAVRGLAGVEDAPRGGGPPSSSREPGSATALTALTAPQTLGLPNKSWTRDA